MSFDFRGWVRQPSTILGFGTIGGLMVSVAASYAGGSVGAITAAGIVVFGIVHLLMPDNSQAAADAQALAIDTIKGVASHTMEVQIPVILRDLTRMVSDIAPPKGAPELLNADGSVNDQALASAAKAPLLRVAAAFLAVLTLGGSLAACTSAEQTTAIQAAAANGPCLLAIQAKLASEPTATNVQKGVDAEAVATTNASCLAVATDTATLVQEATAPTTTAPATATTSQ